MAVVPAAPRSGAWRSFLHVVARDFTWLLRGACIVLLIASVIFMATFWYAAIASIALLLVCYALLVMAEGIDHWTDDAPDAAARAAIAPPPSRPTPQEADEIIRTAAWERRGGRIVVEILLGAAVIAAAAAFSSGVPWEVLPIAALVVFGYAILVTTPMWLAWLEEDLEQVDEELAAGASPPDDA